MIAYLSFVERRYIPLSVMHKLIKEKRNIMKIEYENWPPFIRFFSPQIYRYNLKTFIPPLIIILFMILYYSRTWYKGDELDITWKLGLILGIGLILLTVFQLRTYFWIKKNSSLQQIPSTIKQKNRILTLFVFLFLPVVLTILSLLR